MRAIKVCEDLSQNFGMHLFDADMAQTPRMRSAERNGHATDAPEPQPASTSRSG